MGPATHRHPHGRDFGRAFAVGVAINLGFVLVEVVCRPPRRLAGPALRRRRTTWATCWACCWPGAPGGWRAAARSARRTYGLRRSTILAALANAILLLLAVGAIASEAIRRLGTPQPVAGLPVILVAAAGVIVNGATALLFRPGRHHDLNVRGAFLHMAADAAVSLGVVAGGLIIRVAGWTWLDPALSLAIVAVIRWGRGVCCANRWTWRWTRSRPGSTRPASRRG